jgi:predicted MFS family arabinose efflux permease
MAANDDGGDLDLAQLDSKASRSGNKRTKRTIFNSRCSRVYEVLSWTPPNCRWDPEKPPQFSMALNVLFAFAGAFTVANLYYSHPILNIIANDFQVPYERVSQIPTLMQAGYAIGLFFLCPLGDLLRRRPFVLCLVLFTATLWLVYPKIRSASADSSRIALCLTKSLATFSAISFIVAISTVTPQLMLPLVGDLAPPHRRAAALSIVVSGFILGILIARVLSGTIANFTSWRIIYWMACGLQYLIFLLLWFFMPDYPSKNPDGLNYFKMLWSILTILVKSPILVQACLISFFNSATFTNYWTTLTFLLSGPPYHYSPLVIGLFGLIGIASMCFGPIYARLVTDRFVPLFSVIVGDLFCLVGIVISTYTGTFTIAGPIIQAFANDFGMQTAQIANRSAIYSLDAKARNRINVSFMLATFCGQLCGTAVGNHVYFHGGWIRSGSASVGFIGASLLFCFIRGPWETGWIGWRGGWGLRKKDKTSADGRTAETTFYATRNDGDVEQVRADLSSIEKALDEMAAEESPSGIAENDERGDSGSESKSLGRIP